MYTHTRIYIYIYIYVYTHIYVYLLDPGTEMSVLGVDKKIQSLRFTVPQKGYAKRESNRQITKINTLKSLLNHFEVT